MKRWAILLLLTSAMMAADTKTVRAYIGTHDSWIDASSVVGTATSGATRAEQIKTFAKECRDVTITDDRSRADFFVAWDSKTWQQTSWVGHENEFTVYNAAKDMVGSGAAHHMKNAARDICKMITASLPH